MPTQWTCLLLRGAYQCCSRETNSNERVKQTKIGPTVPHTECQCCIPGPPKHVLPIPKWLNVSPIHVLLWRHPHTPSSQPTIFFLFHLQEDAFHCIGPLCYRSTCTPRKRIQSIFVLPPIPELYPSQSVRWRIHLWAERWRVCVNFVPRDQRIVQKIFSWAQCVLAPIMPLPGSVSEHIQFIFPPSGERTHNIGNTPSAFLGQTIWTSSGARALGSKAQTPV